MESNQNIKERCLVSIITVAYNSEKTIKRTIESVLAQDYDYIEYIIQDGLSTDKTLEIAKNYEKDFNKRGFDFIVRSEKDFNLYDAMNKGIMKARGDLVGIINSDDWYEPTAIKDVVNCFIKEKFDLMYAELYVEHPDGKRSLRKAKELNGHISSLKWNHPTTFVRSEIAKEIQYSLDSIFADFDFVLSTRKLGYKLFVLNKPIAHFSMGGISTEAKSIKQILSFGRARWRIYQKNGLSILYFPECYLQEIGISIYSIIGRLRNHIKSKHFKIVDSI